MVVEMSRFSPDINYEPVSNQELKDFSIQIEEWYIRNPDRMKYMVIFNDKKTLENFSYFCSGIMSILDTIMDLLENGENTLIAIFDYDDERSVLTQIQTRGIL
jgi:hypothetical protein